MAQWCPGLGGPDWDPPSPVENYMSYEGGVARIGGNVWRSTYAGSRNTYSGCLDWQTLKSMTDPTVADSGKNAPARWASYSGYWINMWVSSGCGGARAPPWSTDQCKIESTVYNPDAVLSSQCIVSQRFLQKPYGLTFEHGPGAFLSQGADCSYATTEQLLPRPSIDNPSGGGRNYLYKQMRAYTYSANGVVLRTTMPFFFLCDITFNTLLYSNWDNNSRETRMLDPFPQESPAERARKPTMKYQCGSEIGVGKCLYLEYKDAKNQLHDWFMHPRINLPKSVWLKNCSCPLSNEPLSLVLTGERSGSISDLFPSIQDPACLWQSSIR